MIPSKTNNMKPNKFFIIFCLLTFIAVIAAGQRDCFVPVGALNWNNPSDFDASEDRILIFAKKVGNVDSVVYINIETPTQDPLTYGAPDTNLAALEGVIPGSIQYENDPLAMLIYNDTGSCCFEFSGIEDTTYFFAIFRTDDGIYSNASYARGQTIAVNRVFQIVMSNATRAQWRKPPSVVLDTVIVVYSTDSLIIKPTGYASNYLTGLSNNYTHNTAYLNGVDDSQGKVLYNNRGTKTTVSGLPVGMVWINIFTNQDTCWSKPVSRLFDTR